MKPFAVLIAAVLPFAAPSRAHDLGGDLHPHDDLSARPPEGISPTWFLAQAGTPKARPAVSPSTTGSVSKKPALAALFAAFSPKVNVRWDARYLYVETSGLPDHGLMKGITAWQQQVPLPQNYTGANAWQVPLSPVPAKEPRSIKGQFLRGAIALAANGVPIFNPQNNRGEVSAEIGELDEWGGHCGRADDYHYHAAPLHLQDKVGKGRPIAVALDGYPIYGLTEADGSAPAGLDTFNGHTTAALGYHYHASTKYPYVNGGFHGEVTEAGGQVDPQPSAQSARGAGSPLRGAKITGFELTGKDAYKLSYEVAGDQRAILYAVNADGSLGFEYQNGSAGSTKETYTRRGGGGGGGRETRRAGNGEDGGARPEAGGRPENGTRPEGGAQNGGRPGAPAETARGPITPDIVKPIPGFVLRSPVVSEGTELPKEFTGDGSSATPPLEWSGAPAGTKSFALIMHHIPGPGDMKWYWTLYHIPASVHALAKNGSSVGVLGNNSVNGRTGYAPPHSKGPGTKKYTLTVYALSGEPKLSVPAAQVNRDVLLAAIKDLTLGTAELNVTYTRTAEMIGAGGNEPPGGPQAGPGEGGPPPGGPGGGNPPPPRPEIEALDLNHDGVIDAGELAKAPASLKALDKDGDGKLSREELRPPRPPQDRR